MKNLRLLFAVIIIAMLSACEFIPSDITPQNPDAAVLNSEDGEPTNKVPDAPPPPPPGE